MEEKYLSIAGDNSENEWRACVNRTTCGFIGVRTRSDARCPDCGDALEKFGGTIYQCADCKTEYVGKGDAEDCCAR